MKWMRRTTRVEEQAEAWGHTTLNDARATYRYMRSFRLLLLLDEPRLTLAPPDRRIESYEALDARLRRNPLNCSRKVCHLLGDRIGELG